MSYTRNDTDTLNIILEQHNMLLPDDVAALITGQIQNVRYNTVLKICADHDIDVSEVVDNFTSAHDTEDRIFAVRSHANSSVFCDVEWEKF